MKEKFLSNNNNLGEVQLGSGHLLRGSVLESRDGRPYSLFNAVPYGYIRERFAEATLAKYNWEGVKEFTVDSPMPICPQFRCPSGLNVHANELTCLTLNVAVPETGNDDKGLLPVMVYYHGGGYTRGNSYMYGPKYFMDEDVIIVTVHYRVGVFGFLSTGDEVAPGNNGLKDCLLALHWVHQHIKQFGGDSSNITIFGDSTGGSITHLLLLSPKSKGLFSRVICSSGSGLAGWSYHPKPRDSAVDLVNYLKEKNGIEKSDQLSSEEILRYLRTIPTDELNDAQALCKPIWPTGFFPMFFGPVKEPEGDVSILTPFLTHSPWELTFGMNKPVIDVPILFGITEDEGAFRAGHVISEEKLTQDLSEEWDELMIRVIMYEEWIEEEEVAPIYQKLKDVYFGGGTFSLEKRDELADLFSDAICGYTVYKSAMALAERGEGPIYLYQYAFHGPTCYMALGWDCPEYEARKVGHADDLLMLFEMVKFIPKGEDRLLKVGSAHEMFSRHFVKLWTSFAITGKPNHKWGSSPRSEWEPLTEEEASPLSQSKPRWFRIDTNPEMVDVDGGFLRRMRMWDELYKDYFEKFLLE